MKWIVQSNLKNEDDLKLYENLNRLGKYKTEECTEQYLYDYVNAAINRAVIADAFVIDVAISEGTPHILEINNINSSGLYAIDSMKWIMAMEDLATKYKSLNKVH